MGDPPAQSGKNAQDARVHKDQQQHPHDRRTKQHPQLGLRYSIYISHNIDFNPLLTFFRLLHQFPQKWLQGSSFPSGFPSSANDFPYWLAPRPSIAKRASEKRIRKFSSPNSSTPITPLLINSIDDTAGALPQGHEDGVRTRQTVELLDRPVKSHLSLLDHIDVLAQRPNLLQNVRGKDHRMLLCNQANQGTDVRHLIRVQSVRRFIENHDIRLMDNRLGNSHPLLVTAGKIADQPLPEVGDLAQFRILALLRRVSPGFPCPAELSGIIQILIHVQIPVHGRLLRQEPDLRFR